MSNFNMIDGELSELSSEIRKHLADFLKEKDLYSDFCSRVSLEPGKMEKRKRRGSYAKSESAMVGVGDDFYQKCHKNSMYIDDENYIIENYHTYYFDDTLVKKDAREYCEGLTYNLSEEEKKEKIGKWFIENKDIDINTIIDLLVQEYNIDVCELCRYCSLYYINEYSHHFTEQEKDAYIVGKLGFIQNLVKLSESEEEFPNGYDFLKYLKKYVEKHDKNSIDFDSYDLSSPISIVYEGPLY